MIVESQKGPYRFDQSMHFHYRSNASDRFFMLFVTAGKYSVSNNSQGYENIALRFFCGYLRNPSLFTQTVQNDFFDLVVSCL